MQVPSPEAEPPHLLRAAMRQLASGVSIITVGEAEARAGFTATSVTSLTLEPPCLLVCINRKVSALAKILDTRRFGVNVLADHHAGLASRFSGAGGIKGVARFSEGQWTQTEPGVPLLTGALASIACDLEETIERHSHLILIGAVRHIRLDHHGTPLLYAQGEYGRFAASSRL